MIDDAGSVPGGNHNGRLRRGQTVELTRGILTGLTGVLESFRDPNRCLLRLNVAENGVLLCINAEAVRECQHEQQTAEYRESRKQ
jgi:hypothetical protein